MKKLLSLIALALSATCSFAQAELSIADFTIQPGETKEVLINMTSEEENIVTIGASIVLPEGLSFVKAYSRNRYYMELTDRKDDHTVSSDINGAGALKFLTTSLSMAPFWDLEGALLKFTVTADEEIPAGEMTISIVDIEINTDAQEVIKQENVTATVTVPAPAPTVFTVKVEGSEFGEVTGAGEFEAGKECTLTATAISGYKFVKWSDDSTENPYTFTVTEDVTISPIFEEDLETAITAAAIADAATVYTLTGVKMNGKLTPGLYIKSGRKVVVK